MQNATIYIALLLMGLCVGSFCNVLITRIPAGEEFIKTPSHCRSCNHRLSWRENIPLLSFLLQGGKCRSCGRKIPVQYPAVESSTPLMWLLTGMIFTGDWLKVALFCVFFSLLLVIAVIDQRTLEIPNGLTLAVLILGLIRLFTDFGNWQTYVIGLFPVSLLFLIIWFITQGTGIGMGDVKLMGAAGLLVGWQNIILGMFAGCILGTIIHLFRMNRGAGHTLAFGPYLAAGTWLAALFGDMLITRYLALFAF